MTDNQQKRIPSIYIRHVLAEISEEEVIKILEETYKLGKVDKIYSRPKISEKDGHEYYCCDIHFKWWSNDPNAIEILNRKKTRLNYSGDKYWQIKLFQGRYDTIKNETKPINIYVIYHKTFENTNIFTTDESKITEIINKQTEKNEDTIGEWKYRTIVENIEFQADMDC